MMIMMIIIIKALRMCRVHCRKSLVLFSFTQYRLPQGRLGLIRLDGFRTSLVAATRGSEAATKAPGELRDAAHQQEDEQRHEGAEDAIRKLHLDDQR